MLDTIVHTPDETPVNAVQTTEQDVTMPSDKPELKTPAEKMAYKQIFMDTYKKFHDALGRGVEKAKGSNKKALAIPAAAGLALVSHLAYKKYINRKKLAADEKHPRVIHPHGHVEDVDKDKSKHSMVFHISKVAKKVGDSLKRKEKKSSDKKEVKKRKVSSKKSGEKKKVKKTVIKSGKSSKSAVKRRSA